MMASSHVEDVRVVTSNVQDVSIRNKEDNFAQEVTSQTYWLQFSFVDIFKTKIFVWVRFIDLNQVK